MKSIIFPLILIHICSVQSNSLNFGNFFHGGRAQQQQGGVQQQSSISNQPPSEQKVEYEYPPQYPSESYSEYRSESDPYVYNMSSDLIDSPSDTWNSSYESTNSSVSQSEQSNTTTTSEHSISSTDSKSSTAESSGGGEEVVWNEMTSSPASSTTPASVVVTSAATNATSDGENEKVVLGSTAGTTTEAAQKTIFQKTIEWAKDDYILSILVPVAAGVIFAVSVICTIALCRCCRRCCCRRRFRKKCLPDSVRNLSSSDRKRLLGDMSSDDEF